jgi:hypothetical protein
MALYAKAKRIFSISTDNLVDNRQDNRIILENRQTKSENENDFNQILSVNDVHDSNSRNYNSTANIQETILGSSSTNLLDNGKKANQSKTNIIVISILFIINLINYVDRFTLAGRHFLYVFSKNLN